MKPLRNLKKELMMKYDQAERIKRQAECEHKEFMCYCDVNRLSEKEGGPINRYSLGVRVQCSECLLPFRFIGLPAGMDLNGAAVSIDACEGRFAIAPKGQVISVLEGGVMGFSVRNEGPPPPLFDADAMTDLIANFVDEAIRKGTCSTHAEWQAQIHALLTTR